MPERRICRSRLPELADPDVDRASEVYRVVTCRTASELRFGRSGKMIACAELLSGQLTDTAPREIGLYLAFRDMSSLMVYGKVRDRAQAALHTLGYQAL